MCSKMKVKLTLVHGKPAAVVCFVTKKSPVDVEKQSLKKRRIIEEIRRLRGIGWCSVVWCGDV